MLQLVRRLDAEGRLVALNIAVALVIALGVFRLLPVRSFWIDAPAVIVLLLLASSSVAVARRLPWAKHALRATGIALLATGIVAFATLTLGATFSRAVVASAGAAPGPMLYLLIALVVLPYTVFYGIGLLLWLGAREPR